MWSGAELKKGLATRGFEYARVGVRTGRILRAKALRPLLLKKAESRGNSERPDGVTLFWIPEAGVGPHLVAMEILARTLVGDGQSVMFTRCYECFARCPVMDMYELAEPTSHEAARSCCDRCIYNSVAMLGRYRLPAMDLRPWVERIRPELDRLRRDRPADLKTFHLEGIAFGAIALHDLILTNKLASADHVSPHLGDAWWDRISSCVTAYLVVSEMARSGTINQLVHFNDGSLQVSARLAAEKAGVPCRSLAFASHLGVDRRKLVITNTIAHDALVRHASTWTQWRNIPLGAEVVRDIGDDLVRHFTNPGGASHIYSRGLSSRPDDLRRRLGLSSDRKVVVAFTSSLDEDNAARAYRAALGIDCSSSDGQTFPDQLTWLRHVADQISVSEDLQLIVRVHPREDANDRDGVRSEHLSLLRDELGKDRAHVHVVWPRDPVSSYDLSLLAHVATVSWSSIGLELARAGTPVLATSVGVLHTLPRNEGVAWEATPAGYSRRLRELSIGGFCLEEVISAYRFYAMRQLALTTDLGDIVAKPGSRYLPRWRTPHEAPRLLGILNGSVDRAQTRLGALHAT